MMNIYKYINERLWAFSTIFYKIRIGFVIWVLVKYMLNKNSDCKEKADFNFIGYLITVNFQTANL